MTSDDVATVVCQVPPAPAPLLLKTTFHRTMSSGAPDPGSPVSPLGPCSPVAPVSPLTPWGPTAPAGPAGRPPPTSAADSEPSLTSLPVMLLFLTSLPVSELSATSADP